MMSVRWASKYIWPSDLGTRLSMILPNIQLAGAHYCEPRPGILAHHDDA